MFERDKIKSQMPQPLRVMQKNTRKLPPARACVNRAHRIVESLSNATVAGRFDEQFEDLRQSRRVEIMQSDGCARSRRSSGPAL